MILDRITGKLSIIDRLSQEHDANAMQTPPVLALHRLVCPRPVCPRLIISGPVALALLSLVLLSLWLAIPTFS